VSEPLAIPLPVELIEALVEAVSERVLDRLAEQVSGQSPWLSGAKAAAEYLGWPIERIYKQLPALPHYRHGQRLMFRRDELDGHVEAHREGSRT
jgi:hypothetical protein